MPVSAIESSDRWVRCSPIRGAVPPLSSTAQERFMVAKLSEPKIITDADIDPRHDWSRAIYAPGTMAVDFEERIDFRRLHRYRLARTRQALKSSGLDALLVFDANNIRYMTSTSIGEWSRDTLGRFAVLAGD